MQANEIRQAVGRVARESELRLVVLFGSASRPREGPMKPGDLDLAVDAGAPIDALDLTNRFAVALSRNDVDLVDLKTADPVLLMCVAEEGVPVYEALPGAFARFQSLAVRRFHDTRKFRDLQRQELHARLDALKADR